MNKKTFFANAASKALALAATVMMSLAFAACGSDSNDDGGSGGTPEPLPTPNTQTVTLDGVEKPILKAEYEDKGYNNNYLLYLYLSVDYKEDVQFVLNKDQHMTGNPIDLTKKEKEHAGYYWSIEYHESNGSSLINIFGRPDNSFPVFITGTLTATGNPKSGKVSIKLENGRVEGKDGKEHTLTVSYIGPITKE